MTNSSIIFQNQNLRRIILDDYFPSEVEMCSQEFRLALRFLRFLELNFDENVLLNIDSTPDAIVVLLIEFMRFYNQSLKLND